MSSIKLKNISQYPSILLEKNYNNINDLAENCAKTFGGNMSDWVNANTNMIERIKDKITFNLTTKKFNYGEVINIPSSVLKETAEHVLDTSYNFENV